MRAEFIAALEKAGVDYELRSSSIGVELIVWNEEQDQQVQSILETIVGEKPPVGRSIPSAEGHQLEFLKQSFSGAGIPYRQHLYWGTMFLVWPEEYTEKVKELNDGIFADSIYEG